jgi:hypothetical protein
MQDAAMETGHPSCSHWEKNKTVDIDFFLKAVSETSG